ncbi:hypothetical protein LIER_17843 [Lithospermum erythrorhizon]|uniref:Reverse transcriptase Ty1/copia-type domain-containing protein n=1 Tax=Lithospermum erythrorhizon TaxID=34254 RepID=A0AAV3QBZ1_LITER
MERDDCKDWLAAMEEEMSSLHKNNTYILVDRTEATKILKIDYGKIFSPIIKMISIRLVLGLAVSLNMKIEQLDIKTAFLHDNLEENIFMKQPEGFKEKGKEDITCKLQKSLYGLNQAPRQWTNRI